MAGPFSWLIAFEWLLIKLRNPAVNFFSIPTIALVTDDQFWLRKAFGLLPFVDGRATDCEFLFNLSG